MGTLSRQTATELRYQSKSVRRVTSFCASTETGKRKMVCPNFRVVIFLKRLIRQFSDKLNAAKDLRPKSVFTSLVK